MAEAAELMGAAEPQPAPDPATAALLEALRPRRGRRRSLPDMRWMARARCRGLDPAIFHPETDADAAEAKEICGACPVREACLEFAIEMREKDGVWGGHTADERRRLIRRRRRRAQTAARRAAALAAR
jgi:WhiB family redox-sensing transcriptional regulator